MRRLLNTSDLEGFNQRLVVIEEYIQVLVNSGHKYAFIKAIVLQAITKYEYMHYRDNLTTDHIKYQPLYRPRSYNEDRSKILEYMNWYTNHELGEPFRQGWKRFINKTNWREGNVKGRKKTNCGKDERVITTAMFVPPSLDGKLLSLLEEVEHEIQIGQ